MARINACCRYVLMALSQAVIMIFLRYLQRTTVIGAHHIPYVRNRLLLAKHLSALDSYLAGTLCIWPQSLLRPHLFPFHIAKMKPFYRLWPLSWLFRWWGCIMIHPGKGDFMELVPTTIGPHLQTGTVMIFPEGTRDRHPRPGQLQKFNKGAALLVQATRPIVVPIGIWGTQDIVPPGCILPRLWRRVVFVIGKPIDFSDPCYDHATTLTLTGVLQEALTSAQQQACDHYAQLAQ